MPFDADQPLARQPRGTVKLNDKPIVGWTRCEIGNNTFAAADTFSVTFAASALPSDRDAAWMSKQRDMYVEIFAGLPDDPEAFSSDDLTSWIYGQADEISFDAATGLIEVSGRDLTRVFIDTKTTEKWPNRTASQIATELAARHDLKAVVTPTTRRAGTFYQRDYVNLADERTEWDILCYLAREEGYRVYVRGKTLHFEPAPDEDAATPYVVEWRPPETEGGPPACNVSRLDFSRSLTVSRGIQVVVRSFNQQHGKAFTVTFPGHRAKSIGPGQSSLKNTQVFYKTFHNITPEQANKRAQELYAQLIQHEMRVRFDMPADNELDVGSVLEVRGTGTAWDQRYYPDTITRTLDIDTGYAMRVTAKNHSPETETSA